MSEHECSECGCNPENLHGMSPYNGNTNRNFYCEDCFVVVFGRPFEITTIGEDNVERSGSENEKV